MNGCLDRSLVVLSFITTRLRDEYKDIHDEASPDVGKYLSNPINAYRLVKRLTMDWKIAEAALTTNPGAGNNNNTLTI